jgi:acyl-CoA synthetase (AMP-forming)/AMP-acid ligase II
VVITLLFKKLIEDHLSDKVILRYESDNYTYKELYEMSLSLGSWFINKGAVCGDRIMVSCVRPSDTVIALLACLAYGLIFVPVEQGNSREESHIIDDSGAKIVYRGEHHDNVISKPREAQSAETVGYIIYTSGSTSVSKGVVAPLRAIDYCIEAINKRLNNHENDRILSRLPLSFDYGLYQVFLSLCFGAQITLMDSEDSILTIPKIATANGITILPVVPTLLAALLRARLLKGEYFPYLRYISSTGEVLDTRLILSVYEALPNVEIIPMYGLTECKRVSIMPPNRKDKILAGSCGLPLDGMEVRLIDDNEDEGELLVFGPNIMNGYWNDPATTSAVFRTDRDGRRYLKTGDAFYIDNEGFLFFRRRLKNLIKVSGHAVSGTDLEEFIMAIDDVIDVRIIGLPDEVFGESICACIYTNVDEIKARILELTKDFPSYKQIRKVIILKKPFPTNKNGKVDILKLREMAGELSEI